MREKAIVENEAWNVDHGHGCIREAVAHVMKRVKGFEFTRLC